MFKYLDILACAIFVIYCVHVVIGDSCGSCDADDCDPPPDECLAGRVKDACDCCFVCGRKEGERCDSQELNYVGFGDCGDNLECRVRNDLDFNDPPEAVCVCVEQSPLCGSDGVTYENRCQLTEARYLRRDGLIVMSAEPCVNSPIIVTAPQNVKNTAGSLAAMSCEAKAWPLPTIEWFVQRNDSLELEQLPGNSNRVGIQSRGGPGVDETTSWLFFTRIDKDVEGVYVCKVENYAGSDTANATVTVTP